MNIRMAVVEKKNNCVVVMPPDQFDVKGVPSVFLAGSIDQGAAPRWDLEVIESLSDVECVVFNPRRKDWDKSWIQSIDNPKFREQVEWELCNLEQANLIALCFTKESKAPISFLEMGLHISEGRMIVHCPEGFYRKGNVDIVCARYGVPVLQDFEDFKREVKRRLGEPVMRKPVMASDRIAWRIIAKEFVMRMNMASNTKKLQDAFDGDLAYFEKWCNPKRLDKLGYKTAKDAWEDNPVLEYKITGWAKKASTASMRIASTQRYCGFYKAVNGKWYMDLANDEHGEESDATTYGPFSSLDVGKDFLHHGFSNPGGYDMDDSGKKTIPHVSPNGFPVQKPDRRSHTAASTIKEGDVCKVDMWQNQFATDDILALPKPQLKILKDIVKQGGGKVLVESIKRVWRQRDTNEFEDIAFVRAYDNPVSRMVGGVDVPISILKVVGHTAAGSNHKDFATKREALKFLEDHALMSVGWKEGSKEKEACYWNGKVHITDADAKKWASDRTAGMGDTHPFGSPLRGRPDYGERDGEVGEVYGLKLPSEGIMTSNDHTAAAIVDIRKDAKEIAQRVVDENKPFMCTVSGTTRFLTLHKTYSEAKVWAARWEREVCMLPERQRMSDDEKLKAGFIPYVSMAADFTPIRLEINRILSSRVSTASDSMRVRIVADRIVSTVKEFTGRE